MQRYELFKGGGRSEGSWLKCKESRAIKIIAVNQNRDGRQSSKIVHGLSAFCLGREPSFIYLRSSTTRPKTVYFFIYSPYLIFYNSLRVLCSQIIYILFPPTMFNSLRFTSRLGLRAVRWNSTASSGSPPLMAHMRNDLKVAMRAKDTARYGDLQLLLFRPGSGVKRTATYDANSAMVALG